MEAEEELEILQNLVSLPVLVRKVPEIINYYPSFLTNHQFLKPLLKFFLLLYLVEYPTAVRPNMYNTLKTKIGNFCGI